MPRGIHGSAESKARRQAFDEVCARYGFSRYGMQSYGSSLRQSWMREHVPAHEAQGIARRAFEAVDRCHKGLGGRPRFKSWHRGLRSMESKDHGGALRPVFDEQGILFGLRWGRGLVVGVAKPSSEKETTELLRLSRAVESGWLYARITRTPIAGRTTYRAQFVCNGKPVVRHPQGDEKVCIDLGPSIADVVHDTGSFTVPLAEKVDAKTAELRRLQRRLDRQHRAGSPSCFNPDGTHIKGACHWKNRSRSALRTQVNIAELYRKVAEYRKCEHGRLWNQIRAIGTDVRLEKLNYVAWQKTFPRSVRNKAPGLFVEIGRHKAESAGGPFFEFSTYSTALSKSCICGERNKKRLSERTHHCKCGVVAPRDRFSAFLGLYVYRQVDTETKEVQDLLDVEGAKAGFLNRHDIGGHPGRAVSKHEVHGGEGCTIPAQWRAARLGLVLAATERFGGNLHNLCLRLTWQR